MAEPPSPDLSAAVLRQTWELAARLLQNLTHPAKRQRALRMALREIATELNAGNCSIFLLTPGDPSTMELVESENRWSRLPERPVPQLWIKGSRHLGIKGSPHGGLSAWAAGERRPLLLNAEQIRTSVFRGTRQGLHLGGHGLLSFMAVPLFRANHGFDGLLKCENKIDAKGEPHPDLEFSKSDLARLQFLASVVYTIANELRYGGGPTVRDQAEAVMQDVHELSNREAVLQAIIDKCVECLEADRGEFAWWTGEAGTLVYAAQTGETKPIYKPGGRVPDDAFVRAIFNGTEAEDTTINGDVGMIPDVTLHKGPYVAAGEKTRSELAVRVDLHGNPVGVINVESQRPGFFEEAQIPLLRQLAQQAARAVQRVQREQLMRVALNHEDKADRVLQPILHGVLETCGFDGGILYRRDRRGQCLRVAAWRAEGVNEEVARNFSHSLVDGPSFARRVFERTDADLPMYWDPTAPGNVPIHPEGLKIWNIHSPLLGYPISFNAERVGCLVLWAIERGFPSRHPPASRLEEFARLAAAKLAFWETKLELDEQLDRYRTLADSSPLFVFIKRKTAWDPGETRPEGIELGDPKFVFESANQKFLDHVQLNEESLRNKTDWDLFDPQAAKYYGDDCDVLHGKKLEGKRELHQRSGDQAPMHVLVWKTLITSTDGTERLLVVFYDRSEEQRLEEATSATLTQKQVMFEDLFHRVKGCFFHAHGVLTDQLARGDGTDHRTILAECLVRLDCMAAVVNSLYGRRRGEFVEINGFLSEVIEIVRTAFRPPPGEAEITVEARLDDAQFPENAASGCALIVTELLANSLRYAFKGRESGQVKIALRKGPEDWQLSIADDGVGTEHKKPFKPETVGLGLVQQLVEQQLGGKFEFDGSTGQGTRFVASFQPRSTPVAAALSPLPAGSDKLPVLIVENDVRDALICQRWLGSDYHVLGRVASKADALAALTQFHPCAIIMDIEFSDSESGRREGLAIAQAIREVDSEVPIVFLTQLPMHDPRVEEASKLAHANVLFKSPCVEENLRLRVRQTMLLRRRKRKIFVCYASEEKKYLDELLPYLRPLESEGLEIWSDQQIKSGDNWKERINQALNDSVAAVALGSGFFRDSEFITKVELPALLRKAAGEGLKLCWVMLFPFDMEYGGNTLVSETQFAAGTVDNPIGILPDSERKVVWYKIATQIKAVLSLPRD